MSVFVIATLDTKGVEAAFLRDQLREMGIATTLVDAGSLAQPVVDADIPRERVFAEAEQSLSDLVARNDRGAAVTAAALGAERVIRKAFVEGKVDGVLALGGSAGTTIGTQAMRALPIGVPKLMISTLASGQVRQWVADKDILMLNSIVDIAGINRISKQILHQAAAAMAGMVKHRQPPSAAAIGNDKPLIAASMFGVTTPCVQQAREILESAGYEVLVFHATGNGGQAMESLIRDGLIAGVLDITTTELADELVGGILSAGPDRLTAAGERGIPQVVSVGALDMVNFGPPATVPERFAHRKFYQHNPSVTLMRTTVDECAKLGEEIGRKVAATKGLATIMLPLRGISAIEAEGKPFHDPDARTALFAGIRGTARVSEIVELEAHINDAAFATAAARRLLEMLKASNSANSHRSPAVVP